MAWIFLFASGVLNWFSDYYNILSYLFVHTYMWVFFPLLYDLIYDQCQIFYLLKINGCSHPIHMQSFTGL